MTDTYDLGQAARFLGLDVSQVLRLVESGQLPSTQAGPDGEVFISGQTLTRFAVANFGKSA